MKILKKVFRHLLSTLQIYYKFTYLKLVGAVYDNYPVVSYIEVFFLIVSCNILIIKSFAVLNMGINI